MSVRKPSLFLSQKRGRSEGSSSQEDTPVSPRGLPKPPKLLKLKPGFKLVKPNPIKQRSTSAPQVIKPLPEDHQTEVEVEMEGARRERIIL